MKELVVVGVPLGMVALFLVAWWVALNFGDWLDDKRIRDRQAEQFAQAKADHYRVYEHVNLDNSPSPEPSPSPSPGLEDEREEWRQEMESIARMHNAGVITTDEAARMIIRHQGGVAMERANVSIPLLAPAKEYKCRYCGTSQPVAAHCAKCGGPRA